MTRSAAESVESMERLVFETFGVIPGAEVRHDGNSVLLRTGYNVDLCNGVFQVRWNEKTAERELERYIAEFGRTGTPFIVHTSDLSTPGLGANEN